MSRLNATWSVDAQAFEDSNRGYPMTIEPGGLYEVWLPFSEGPQPAVAISQERVTGDGLCIWNILTDGRMITQREGRIFATGTAKRPELTVEEMNRMVAQEIAAAEDQRILKLLSEMTVEKP